MSLSGIIDELPRLSHQERRELCRRVIGDHIAREGHPNPHYPGTRAAS